MLRKLFAGAMLGSLVGVGTLGAQAFLSRTPNMDGTWIPDRHALQFNLIHRFYVTPAPGNIVINTPTLTFAIRLPGALALGLRYATHSAVPGHSNENEMFTRWQFRESGARRIGVAATAAYNSEARSLDGEVGVDYSPSRFTVAAAARGMSDAYHSGRGRMALAGGVLVRLNSYVAVGGDVASLLDRGATEQMAWSAALSFQIPNSPHFFSVQVSNVDLNTIQGSSRRGLLSAATKRPLYGFEFTIPFHYRRFLPWFRPGTGVPPSRKETGVAAVVRMQEFEFRADSIVLTAGQSVQFLNEDPVEHTVTFDAIATSSGLIPKGGTFVLRFDRPGVWAYHCTPHPFMQGVIIVR